MAENFYTILTSTGKAKLANSAVLGSKVNFKTLKVGDGKGAYYEPLESQTSLVNEVWSGNIGSISIDETNTNWIVAETIIPATVGGFFIREAGIFDEDGNLIAISKLSETYKPIVSEGSIKDLCIKIILEVSNVESVTLKIDPTIIVATKKDIQVLEAKVQDVSAQLSDLTYQVAGGTATAITLALPTTLVTGYPKTFIASASNGGVPTKINGKPLYKPGTTTAPNLIAGKAYTVWYNSTGGCFFLKASAEGNTIESHVLAGDTFSNDNDTGIIGTMPNIGAVTQSLAINGSYTIPAGYHNGLGVINQSITTKAAQTYNPSTTAQTIVANQYVSGIQTIAATTGTANVAQVLAGYTFNSGNGIGLTGNIPSKAAQTYTPSTTVQTIASGQYLSGTQTIAATTGTATAADVIAGKTFNSANGIGLTGVATTASLGGKRYASGSVVAMSSFYRSLSISISGLEFTPKVVISRIVGTQYVSLLDLNTGFAVTAGHYYHSTSDSYIHKYYSYVLSSLDVSNLPIHYGTNEGSALSQNTQYTVNWYAYE